MMNKRAGSGVAGPREMRGPTGVDDILAMVNNQRPQASQSKQEDTISSVSSQESTKKRIKIKKPVSNGNGKFVLNLQ
jgi:hypothetical protein